MLPLLLALALAPGTVELAPGPGSTAPWAAPASEAPTPAWAADRAVSISAVDGGVELRARWTLRALAADTWFSGQVLGAMPGLRVESLRLNGAPVATATAPAGVVVAARVSGRATLEVVAFVPGDPTREPLALTLLPAARGRVEVTPPPGLAPTLRAAEAPAPAGPRPVDAPTAVPADAPADGRPALRIGPAFWTGAGRLDLSFGTAPTAPGERAAVVVARAGLGVTVGDADLRGRGRLVWEVRQGTIDAVAFTVAGAGPDLEVTGPNLRGVERSGESVRVTLQAPAQGRVELELRWSTPVARAGESRAPLPGVRFDGVFRSESSLQLARDGEVEVVPAAAGWTPTAAAALPAWGQGLVEGTPTAAFRGGGEAGGHLDLLRFVAIEGPPVVVDVAAYTIAASREGRALIRAHYEVRNERAAALRLQPPPGYQVLGVRVAGTTAMPARDPDGAWRIPLPRSVETVSGLLSFPVEVALLGGAAAWGRREQRRLPLPVLDAPVAVSRATLHLPPGYTSRLRPGDGEVVAAFDRGEGIAYGLGVGEVGAAQADALFQSAVQHWLGNEFDAAQADLDALRRLGARNDNIDRLQGNLDVISGKHGKVDGGAQRRIREQAKARALADQRAQETLRQKAEESRKSGDYAEADRNYRAAIAVGDRLARLEQAESVEQQTRNSELQASLQSNTGEAEARKKQGPARGRKFAGGIRLFGSSGGGGAKSAANRGADGLADDRDADGAGGASPGAGTYAFEGEPLAGAATPVATPPADEPARVVDKEPAARPVERAFADAGAVVPGVTLEKDVATGAAAPPEEAVLAVREPTASVVTTEDIAVVRRAPGLRGRWRERRAARRSSDARRAEAPSPDPTAAAPVTGLPAPVATASAVSVVVPTVGEAVRYQRLLLRQGAAYALEVSARKPLIAKD